MRDLNNTIIKEMYLVGHHIRDDNEFNVEFGWEFMGIFTDKEIADEKCSDEHYFYAPVVLNKDLHGKTEVFPDIVYPRVKFKR